MTTDPSSAVVHLTLRSGENELAVGSGVLYRKVNAIYIVTAWHNVTGRHSESLKPLSKSTALPDNLIAYISCKFTYPDSQIGFLRRPFVIPLENAESAFYLIHPQGHPRVDVVAIPINPEYLYDSVYEDVSGKKHNAKLPMRQNKSELGLGSDISCIQDFEQSATQLNIDFVNHLNVSDDLFILGYPKGIIDVTGQPLWKRATVATAPHLGWNKQKQFLVDCASREGMSGAPAIVHSQGGTFRSGRSVHIGSQSVTFLVGIYVSRIGQVSHFEAQIGTIWQRAVIDEIIEANVVAPHSSQVVANSSEINSAISSSWPAKGARDNKRVRGVKGDYASNILGGGHFLNHFTYAVMDKLNGRANPENVREIILEFAQSQIKA